MRNPTKIRQFSHSKYTSYGSVTVKYVTHSKSPSAKFPRDFERLRQNRCRVHPLR
jgi:hypothetical protein